MGALTLSSFNLVHADTSATFTTTVDEMLTVSLDTPTESGALESDGMVRNKVSLTVSTNNSTGFVASMTTSGENGSLVDSDNANLTIPLLSANTLRSAFGTNQWGYSIDDTAAGSQSSTYRGIALSTAQVPSFIASAQASSTATEKDIYFGAKSSTSGTYSNSVVISVVSGAYTDPTTDDPIVTPTDPVTPTDDTTPNDDTGTYVTNPTGGSANGVTVGTVSRSTGTTDRTVTQISKGDTTGSYTDPQGVTTTTATINEGTPLATGLAVTAGVAAATGIVFFILAKRRKDDDEEDDLDY